ncbi:hypothetical protein V5799_031759 [Amblyomma americanum]|uniref:eIF-4F 25 kDa subunit n=1 Tax=Amblyomma americanum TaxID=6943 RepID=A0AAQ4DT42_AMBAM
MSGENEHCARDPQTKQAETVTSPEERLKHPLEHRWSFWYHTNDRNRTWQENLLEIASFDTVEDFWAVYNHMKRPSEIAQGCDYSMFKYGIKPMWEDSRNRRGGRWFVKLGKVEAATDNCWLEILMCLIGEGFDERGADVCGAVVQVREKADKVSVWTADCRSVESNRQIKEIMKKKLEMHIGTKSSIYYQVHDDTKTKERSSKKAREAV